MWLLPAYVGNTGAVCGGGVGIHRPAVLRSVLRLTNRLMRVLLYNPRALTLRTMSFSAFFIFLLRYYGLPAILDYNISGLTTGLPASADRHQLNYCGSKRTVPTAAPSIHHQQLAGRRPAQHEARLPASSRLLWRAKLYHLGLTELSLPLV